MDCSTPGFSIHHQLLELVQIHVHQVGDAIQPSHPLSSSSPAASWVFLSLFLYISLYSNICTFPHTLLFLSVWVSSRLGASREQEPFFLYSYLLGQYNPWNRTFFECVHA